MKMVKSLLLGSAAGIVAISGAQAADLPVKAKPVEYVKICSLYGAGYYYMPGTDICLKLGGFVRYQLNIGTGNNMSGGPQHGTGGRNTRIDESDVSQRVRAVATIDTRQQTAYGTLRTYMLIGYNQDTTALGTTSPPVYMNRGFIQIAGFTLGKATSFFDIFPNASFAYNAGNNFSGDSGDGGVILATYTAQFGNGFSGSLGIEHQRRLPTVYAVGVTGASLAPFGLGVNPACNSQGSIGVQAAGSATPCPGNVPDLVGNLRVDQSWGTWILAGAAHDVSGGYFGPTAAVNEAFGHPGQHWGWAATTGLILNLPMITPGDRFSIQAVYSEGATAYHAATRSGAGPLYFQGGQVAWGQWTDAIFAGGPGGFAFALTTGWSVNAAFEHLWTPSLKTSFYGSYIEISHNAVGTAMFCAANAVATATFVTTAACNPDWSSWTAGSRTEWEPVKGFTVGADVLYSELRSAQANGAGTTPVTAAQGGKPAITYATSNLGAWVGAFRVQRNFLP